MCARVLVVDDDQVNIDLVEYLLRAFGHEPVVALSGEAALRKVTSETPDLVLCDIQMPGMDGYEVLRRVREDVRYAGIPVVGLTAMAMVGDRERILEAGFDGYFTKPISPETFITEIERYLSPALRSGRTLATAGPFSSAAVRPRSSSFPKRAGYALVVDDNPPNSELLEHLLNSVGVEVRIASNVEQGMRIARESTPSLIVSDLHMPGRTGLEFLADLKADLALKSVPFVLISSSNATFDEERRAQALGVDGMMLRPLEAEAILEYLARWIPPETPSKTSLDTSLETER